MEYKATLYPKGNKLSHYHDMMEWLSDNVGYGSTKLLERHETSDILKWYTYKSVNEPRNGIDFGIIVYFRFHEDAVRAKMIW